MSFDHMKRVMNEGHAHAVLMSPWKKATTGFRYAAVTCCVRITFNDGSEVTRAGDFWYVNQPGREAKMFIEDNRPWTQAMKDYLSGRSSGY